MFGFQRAKCAFEVVKRARRKYRKLRSPVVDICDSFQRAEVVLCRGSKIAQQFSWTGKEKERVKTLYT